MSEAVDALRQGFDRASRIKDPSGRRIDVLDPETLDAVFDSFHPDIELHEDPRFPEAAETYHGREAARDYFTQFTESFDEFSFEVEEYVDLGEDKALVLFRIRMRGKESGATVDAKPGWIFTIRDGKTVRIEAHLDRDEAFAAAGLPSRQRTADL
jgi:ketosteroid isomerase-like protein